MINSYSLREKKKKREGTLSVLWPPLSPRLLSDLLRAECIRNVTWDGGMVDGEREKEVGRKGEETTKESKNGSKCYQ